MKLEIVRDEVDLPWSAGPDWERSLVDGLASVGPKDGLLQVVLTDDATLRELNREYRGLDRPTDVLSFSYLEGHEDAADELLRPGVDLEDYLDAGDCVDGQMLVGQVLVSVETVVRRGAVHVVDLDLDGEMAFMVVHGLLHVLGMDHGEEEQAARMAASEDQVMGAMGWHVLRDGETG